MGVGGGRGWGGSGGWTHVRLRVQKPWEPHQFSFFGFCYFILFYWPQKRSSWIANAWEIFAARPRPSLCEIRKFSSISRFEHDSQKKVTSMPRPRPWFRPRFSDLSFHLQPCPQHWPFTMLPGLVSFNLTGVALSRVCFARSGNNEWSSQVL